MWDKASRRERSHMSMAPAASTIPSAPARESHAAHAPAPVSAERHNLFSLVSFIGAFFVPVVGIVFGHVALKQIARTREPGRGFALAGLWVGYGSIVLFALFLILYFGFILTIIIAAMQTGITAPTEYRY